MIISLFPTRTPSIASEDEAKEMLDEIFGAAELPITESSIASDEETDEMIDDVFGESA